MTIIRLDTLVRLRANPAKIRASILRLDDGGWSYTFTNRETGEYARGWGRTPKQALVVAMRVAATAHLPGMDRHCSWTYDHPQAATETPSTFPETSQTFPSQRGTA